MAEVAKFFGEMGIIADTSLSSQFNYLGAFIFWLYNIFALLFTAVVIHTLIHIKPAKSRHNEQARKRNVLLFSILAATSFGTLSVNMLTVLIHSFNAWSVQYPQSSQQSLVPRIWTWSVTSTLFHDFAEAVVANSARLVWSEMALLVTFVVNLFMGWEGTTEAEFHLW